MALTNSENKPMIRESKQHKLNFTFKAKWDATAIHITVEAKDYEEALRRAETMVKRMEGGLGCQEITLTAIN